MHNLWLITRHEYRQMVFRRGFIFGTLVVPLGFFLFILVIVWFYETQASQLPVGIVDQSALIQAALLDKFNQQAAGDQEIQIRVFPDETSARSALGRAEIQAFFVLPPDYPQTLYSTLFYLSDPPEEPAWQRLNELIRLSLVARLPDAQRERLLVKPRIEVVDFDSKRVFSPDNALGIIFPIIAGILFFLAAMISSNYMLKVVVDEKENRTMEILLTSASADQLIGGKSLGLLAVCFTQLGIYLAAGIIGLLVALHYIEFDVPLTVPWGFLGIMLLFFLPTYILNAAIMVAIGGAFDELQQAQQIAAYVNLVFLFPVFMLVVFFENPSSPVILFLTFFPPTAFLTISIRWGLSAIPAWQIAVSWMLLVLTAGWAVWIAVRVFRIGMLQYGQPLNRKAILSGIREGCWVGQGQPHKKDKAAP
jgi:ABC-2 type transport system permease protein